MTTFFSHHRLPVLQCHPSLFCPKKLTTFFAHHRRFIDISLGRHPTEGVTRGGPPPSDATVLMIHTVQLKGELKLHFNYA